MLDTNILLDWLLDRDPVRTELIDKLFISIKELYIPDVIVVELAFALEKFYELPRNLVSDNLYKIIDEPVFSCNRRLFQRTLSNYSKHPSWSFLDCCLLNYAELQNVLPVWTFDKKLVNQSGGKAQLPTSKTK
jgi:predicted nucleic-acid-binding protein